MLCKDRIDGKNVYLKTLSEDIDFDLYLFWLRDPDINKFLEVRLSLPTCEEDLKKYVDIQNNAVDALLFGIFKNNNTFIGTVRLSNINNYHKTCDIGFMIGDKAQQNKGYAYDAIQCAIRYSKNNLNIRKIYAGCYSENYSSSGLLKKLNFKLAARLKKHWFFNNVTCDQLIFERFI